MWDLSKHEKLEMEILEGLNSLKMLDHLIFCGGTMLRLCHELNRYSVDLDFWLLNKEKEEAVFDAIKSYLKDKFSLKTSKNLKDSIVFEFSAKNYPRNLKIEIRKGRDKVKYEEKIAYSRHSSIQVMVKAATLEDMMRSKIETFLTRVQIRDVFDIEFLVKRGVALDASKKELLEMQKLIKKFKAKAYRVTLGSLLEFKERQYYRQANFRIVLGAIDKILPVQ